MLWSDDPDPSKWPKKNKGAVLSLFRSIKRDLWEELSRQCDPETLPAPPRRRPVALIAAPFRGLVESMLAANPMASGVTILERAREAGYKGSLGTLKAFIASLRPPRCTKVAPFRSLAEAMLAADPDVTMAAILRRARREGYDGSRSLFAVMVGTLRPPRRRRPRRPPRRAVGATARPIKRATPLKPAPALLSPRAAARTLGVSEDRVLLDLARGRFPGALRGRGGWRSWLIPLSDIAGPDPAPASQAG